MLVQRYKTQNYHGQNLSLPLQLHETHFQTQLYNFLVLKQRSPTFLAPGAGFVEDNSSTDRAGGGGAGAGWFRQ